MKLFTPIFAIACLLLFPDSSKFTEAQGIEGAARHRLGADTTSNDKPTQAPTEAPTEASTEAPTEAPTKVPTEAPTPAPIPVNTFFRLTADLAPCFDDLDEAQKVAQYNKLAHVIKLAYSNLVNNPTKFSNPDNYQMSGVNFVDAVEYFRRVRRLGQADDKRELRSLSSNTLFTATGSCESGGGCTGGSQFSGGSRRRLTGTLPDLPTEAEIEAEVMRLIGLVNPQDFDC